MGRFWVLTPWITHGEVISSFEFLDFLTFEACCCRRAFRIFLLSFEEGTTKLEYPRICEVEQHLVMLTMKAYILSILIVVIQCLTGKFNMDLSFLCYVENSNTIENIIHATLYFGITEHVGEHCHEETEKYKTQNFRYSKVDCGAND